MRRDEERAEGRLPGRVPWVRAQEREAEALRAPLVTDADRLTPDTAARLQGLAGNAALARIAGARTPAPAAAAGSAPVQRVTEEELHRHPPGSSLRVRGPRRSWKKDRTPNQVEDPALWRNIEAAAGGRPGLDVEKQRLEISEDPQTLKEQDSGLREQLSAAAFRRPDRDPQAVQHNEMLEDMGRADPRTRPYWDGQNARDHALLAATSALGHERPEAGGDPAFAGAVDDKLSQIARILEGVEGLLAEHEGVIIGDKHKGTPTWAFLTANLARLKSAGVKTVYLESLREDSHQAEIDAYLRSGTLSEGMTRFLSEYDRINDVTGRGMTEFLPEARRQGVRVVGVDGRPARRQRGPESSHRRAATMNTYAEHAVRRDREGREDPGRYLMELGTAHGAAHRSDSGAPVSFDGQEFPAVFPGMSELLGVPAVTYTDREHPETSGLRRVRPGERE
ncbi:hypothetical protein ACWGMW_21580 [Streptomyces albidoflavus]|uniref:hypothetical protein n=1 Tax=Streptomyces albidoflavus TaxID=1886 RepID=UPI001F5D12FA|nr:hypothetical protein [Streptomyces albidoflavus]